MSKVRPVQTSLLPDLAPDKPGGRILPSVFRGTNADLMAAVAPYYLTGAVCDVTYGNGDTAGGWWKRFTPDPFTFHDLALDGVDFRCLPHADGQFDTVCYDPPYVPAGGQRTTTAPEYRSRFGLAAYRSQIELDCLVRDGLAECGRVARTWVLVKCNDYVNARHFTLGHRRVLNYADEIGLTDDGDPWDLIVHETGSGPGGHNIFDPLRARRHHSYLIVFRKAP